jgi:hypothetical protein
MSAQAIENTGVDLPAPKCSEVYENKGTSFAGLGCGRITANRNGESAINETNSSVRAERAGHEFYLSKAAVALTAKSKSCGSIRAHALPVIFAVAQYHGEFAKTSRRRFLGSTVSNASYAK